MGAARLRRSVCDRKKAAGFSLWSPFDQNRIQKMSRMGFGTINFLYILFGWRLQIDSMDETPSLWLSAINDGFLICCFAMLIVQPNFLLFLCENPNEMQMVAHHTKYRRDKECSTKISISQRPTYEKVWTKMKKKQNNPDDDAGVDDVLRYELTAHAEKYLPALPTYYVLPHKIVALLISFPAYFFLRRAHPDYVKGVLLRPCKCAKSCTIEHKRTPTKYRP